MGAGTANPFFLTLRKPEVAEKYLAFVSSPRRSAAEGFTISRPCHRIVNIMSSVDKIFKTTILKLQRNLKRATKVVGAT